LLDDEGDDAFNSYKQRLDQSICHDHGENSQNIFQEKSLAKNNMPNLHSKMLPKE